MNLKKFIPLITICLTICTVSPIYSGTIVGSKHDLSSTWLNEPCKYCHTPHKAASDANATPLWNRYITTQTFTVYSSATIDADGGTIPQPGGASKLCLSCHDGISANGMASGTTGNTKHKCLNQPTQGPSDGPNCTKCHTNGIWENPPDDGGIKAVGIDLRDDHPVSMTYPTDQPTQFNTLSGTAEGDIQLRKGKVECSSCHNVHNPTIWPFLRMSNTGSTLCLTCHIK